MRGDKARNTSHISGAFNDHPRCSMKLNTIEFHLMNNPLRAWCQHRLEARQLLQLGGAAPGAAALEVGCGRGVGTEIILDRFQADRVLALDLDPRMVELARPRLVRFGERVCLKVGDAEAIQADDKSFDAVFDFGIIHHVPDWRRALSELHRVLRPGGRAYIEEVYPPVISGRIARWLLEHPKHDRFHHAELLAGLERAGFTLVGDRCWAGMVGWVVADRSGA